MSEDKIETLGRDNPYPGLEDDLQKSCAAMISYLFPKCVWWHTPNGGYRNAKEGAKFKRMGVKAGVPDILIFTPSSNYNGLAIELKARSGKVTVHQKLVLSLLQYCGWKTVVCYNLESVEGVLNQYFNQKK